MIVFTGVRMIPGDPARVMAGTDADAAGIEAIREKYGLRDPIPLQYLRWMGLALRGDLGHSIRTRESVVATVATKLPITIELPFPPGSWRRCAAIRSGTCSPAARRSAACRFPTSGWGSY